MKTIIALALVAASVGSAVAQPNVGVSIGIHQPGVYGRIDIGALPAPALVLPQPVLIAPAPAAVHRQPIYLYVPPTHQQNWRRYCGQYQACGQPVYFVQDRWVRERYEEQHPGWNRGRHRGWERHDDRGGNHDGDRHDGKHGDKHEDKHGRGHGHGRN